MKPRNRFYLYAAATGLSYLLYVVFQALYALSRKSPEGVIALIQKHLPAPGWMLTLLSGLLQAIPAWVYSPAGVAGTYGFTVVLLFLFFVLALRNIETDGFSLKDVMWPALFFCLILFCSPPGKHADLFYYIFGGKMVSVYHANPYFVRPLDLSNDPLLRFVGWQWTTSAYGPFWNLVSGLLYGFGRGRIVLEIAVYRAFGIGLHLASTYLVYRILEKRRPGFSITGALLYGWNPVCLVYSAADFHNDFLMIAVFLLALFLHETRRVVLAAVCLSCACLAKFVYFLLAPLYVKVLTSKRSLVITIACSAGTAFLLWLPFYDGLVTFVRPFAVTASSYSLLFVWKTFIAHWIPSYSLLAERLWIAIMGGCFLLYYSTLIRRVRCFQEMLYASAVLLFLVVTVVLPAQATWYCSWILPLAILSMNRKLIAVSLAYSFTSLFGLVVYYYTHSYAPCPQVIGTLLEVVPPLALALRLGIWAIPEVNA